MGCRLSETLDWLDPRWFGLYMSLWPCIVVEHWGCWAWICDGPGLREGIVHRYGGKEYIVESCYCLFEDRIYLCVNPDHLDIGGLK